MSSTSQNLEKTRVEVDNSNNYTDAKLTDFYITEIEQYNKKKIRRSFQLLASIFFKSYWLLSGKFDLFCCVKWNFKIKYMF